MEYTMLGYDKCGTCRKAQKWLIDHKVQVRQRAIVQDPPTAAELQGWIAASGLPISKFFNTSGKAYREHAVKDKVKTWPAADLLALLASDGMMVKRPLLVWCQGVLVGFDEQEWARVLR